MSTQQEKIRTGGCQCGAVRFRIRGELGRPSICHCRMCQKAAGNYFLPLAGAPRGRFSLTRGEPGWFASSDVARRGFCRDCGTPLFYDVLGADYIDVTLGSLDDPDDVRPTAQTGVESRLVWFAQLPRLPGHESDEGEEGEARHIRIRDSNRQHPDYDTEHWPATE